MDMFRRTAAAAAVAVFPGWVGRWVSWGLTRRDDAGEPAHRWRQFLAVAGWSRSAQELLAATLQRPVTSRLTQNFVFEPVASLVPLQLEPGEHPVRVLEHLLLDSRPPHSPLGLSSAVIVAARIPTSVRGPMRRGEATLASLLDLTGDRWTAETRKVEQLRAADAFYETGRAADVPVVRLSRLLYLVGTPVAIVVEEIPLPESYGDAGTAGLRERGPRGRGPPQEGLAQF